MEVQSSNLTKAYIHLSHISHNMKLLQGLVGERPMWPAIKANAYGHGLEIVARHLVNIGYDTLCVAHVTEAMELIEYGIDAKYILLSATLPEHSKSIVKNRIEPVLCNSIMLDSLARDAKKLGQSVSVHIVVDTGMGRIGIHPDKVAAFLEKCSTYPSIKVQGLMSHFPCADEADKSLSHQEIDCFKRMIELSRAYDIPYHHMANSAAILDLTDSYFDAVRPGIAIYGLRPSLEISNPIVMKLKPVLEWKTRITFLKKVPAGTGLSYGHTFHTSQSSLIATIPVGYGDGLSRRLSNDIEMLVRGVRCPQVGRITMDQTLIDVTALQGRVCLGDEVVIIGRQGAEEVSADELASKLGTINYEIVTAISKRVQRVAVGSV